MLNVKGVESDEESGGVCDEESKNGGTESVWVKVVFSSWRVVVSVVVDP